MDSVRRVMVGILDEHMEEAQRIAGEESGGDYPAVVMAINPSGYIDVFTAQEFQHMTEEDDAFCEQDIIFDDLLLIHCNPEDVVDLGGIRYLLGTAVIVEMDENGNECSVTHETIRECFRLCECQSHYDYSGWYGNSGIPSGVKVKIPVERRSSPCRKKWKTEP